MLNSGIYSSAVFGNGEAVLEVGLKKPHQYRDAVMFESLSALPKEKRAEFVRSEEAKALLKEGVITDEMLERLGALDNEGNQIFCTSILHLAKEDGDPLWDEFVKCHVEERRLMNELIAKYGDQAKEVAANAQKNIVEAYIPNYFKK